MAEYSRGSGGGLSPGPSYRRRSTNNPENDEWTNRFYMNSQQSRRQSTVIGGNSPFRARSPSDPQNYIEDTRQLSRRYSQPSSPSLYHGTYTDHPSPSLFRQERKTYSSLNHLPEVRTYLQFMEDSTVLPQRSKSFNGRNSSRRSSFQRRRPRSRPRTPTMMGEDQESGLRRVGSGSSSHYGAYLTPRAASLEQNSSHHHLDCDDQGNEADVEDIDGEPTSRPIMQYKNPGSSDRAGVYKDYFPNRRSSIRTTFI